MTTIKIQQLRLAKQVTDVEQQQVYGGDTILNNLLTGYSQNKTDLENKPDSPVVSFLTKGGDPVGRVIPSDKGNFALSNGNIEATDKNGDHIKTINIGETFVF